MSPSSDEAPRTSGVTLYIPEEWIVQFRKTGVLQYLASAEAGGSYPIAPGWWETSHVAWYGVTYPPPGLAE